MRKDKQNYLAHSKLYNWEVMQENRGTGEIKEQLLQTKTVNLYKLWIYREVGILVVDGTSLNVCLTTCKVYVNPEVGVGL